MKIKPEHNEAVLEYLLTSELERDPFAKNYLFGLVFTHPANCKIKLKHGFANIYYMDSSGSAKVVINVIGDDLDIYLENEGYEVKV